MWNNMKTRASLKVAEGARLCGAARIIGVDVNPEKFETSEFILDVSIFW